MGTNYYWQRESDNGRCKDFHIGKDSSGWKFCFHGRKDPFCDNFCISWDQWKKKLHNEKGLIFDEYDQMFTTEEFIKIVEKTKKEPKENIIDYLKKNGDNVSGYWKDKEGWCFNDHDFH